MSHVTNIILAVPSDDSGTVDRCVQEINEYLMERNDVCLMDTRAHFRGPRQMECGVYVGAVNHLAVADLIERVRALNWDEWYEDVQLFLNEPDETAFRERLHEKLYSTKDSF